MRPQVEATRLVGGTANRGRVFRVGDTVHRPAGPHTPAVHALLRHLERVGFDAAPRVVHRDEHTEVLTYLPGEAAIEPLAAWALAPGAIAEVGRLLRSYHDAAAGFDGSSGAWRRVVPARWRGPLVTHNDLNPANVIFRDGRPTALIDFDLAAPATPAWDLAITACFWAPLREESDVDDARRGAAVLRLGELLEGYGAPAALRLEVVQACPDASAWISGVIEDAYRQGHPAFGRLWAEQAGLYARAHAWLRRNERTLSSAVR